MTQLRNKDILNSSKSTTTHLKSNLGERRRRTNASQLDCIQEVLNTGENVTFHVNGMCMHPLLKDRESIIVRRVKYFLPGDFIAYYCQYHKRPVVHRFLGYVRAKASWKLLVMADNAKRPDTLVSKSAVFGKGIPVNRAIADRVHLVHRCRSVWRYIFCLFYLILTHHSRVSKRVASIE